MSKPLSPARVMAIANKITYKPNWKIKVSKTKCPAELRIDVTVKDLPDSLGRYPGPVSLTMARYFPEVGSEAEVVDFVRKCILECERHEFDEWLKYKGELILDPHEPTVAHHRAMTQSANLDEL